MLVYNASGRKLIGRVDGNGDGTWDATAINPKNTHDTKFLGVFNAPGSFVTTLDRAIAAVKKYKFGGAK